MVVRWGNKDFSKPSEDIEACCTAPDTCSTAKVGLAAANTKGFCTGGKFYDAAKKDNDCKALTCVKATAEDQAACCSDGTQALCSTVPALIAAGSFSCPNGEVYNAANHDHKCLALVCDSKMADDTKECCTAPCSTIANTGGFCGSKVYDSSKASNTCAASPCSSGTPADVTACCSPKAQCSSIAGTADWCGTGKVYNANAASTECGGKASCANPADVARCCATPVKCSTVASTSGFCGSGKVFNVAAATTNCAVAPCQGDTTSTKADVSTCCASPVKCSTIATTANFCGTGKVFNVAAANTNCAVAPCQGDTTSTKADVGTCCATPVKCSTVESTSSFCGTGKVYNSAAANTDCAVAPCQGDTTSTKADVARCCKAA